MSGCNLKSLTLVIVMALFVIETCNARLGKQWKQHKYISKSKGQGRGGSFFHGHSVSKLVETNVTFNVLNYGAKGDGQADDTKAFEAAWTHACEVEASTVVVPSGSVFLVYPISFSGSGCASSIVFQLDGKIIAPTSSKAWGSGLLQWLEFTKHKGISIKGKGIIDGQGSVWWDTTSTQANEKMPSTKPTAIRFYGSNGVTVTGITIQNSPQTHLKFDACTNVQVFDISVSSPSDSPNTDGIHLQNSQDVAIYRTDLACGNSQILGFFLLSCSGVSLATIQLKPLQANHELYDPFCWEVYGVLKTTTVPEIGCLMTGNPSNKQSSSNLASCSA